MTKFMVCMLAFSLTGSSILIATNSQAETVIPSESNIIDNTHTSSYEQFSVWNNTVKADVGNTTNNPTSSDQVVVSERETKATDSSSTVIGNKGSVNQRIPLSSRIFDVSSMQQ